VCGQQFVAARNEFHDKFEVYFRLHQEIEANKRDFAALQKAAEVPGISPAEHLRLQREMQVLWKKRGERSARWDAAFKLLHVELTAIKKEMQEFYEQQTKAASEKL
jgi:Occludin homology domain